MDGLVGLYRENRNPALFVKLLSSEGKRVPALQAAQTLLADDKSVVLRQDIAFPLRSLIKVGGRWDWCGLTTGWVRLARARRSAEVNRRGPRYRI